MGFAGKRSLSQIDSCKSGFQRGAPFQHQFRGISQKSAQAAPRAFFASRPFAHRCPGSRPCRFRRWCRSRKPNKGPERVFPRAAPKPSERLSAPGRRDRRAQADAHNDRPVSPARSLSAEIRGRLSPVKVASLHGFTSETRRMTGFWEKPRHYAV